MCAYVCYKWPSNVSVGTVVVNICMFVFVFPWSRSEFGISGFMLPLAISMACFRAIYFFFLLFPSQGMEYVRTHNLALARNFLLGALSLSPSDPLVLNEVRVAI